MWSLITFLTLLSPAGSTNYSIPGIHDAIPLIHNDVFTTAGLLFTDKIHELRVSLPAIELSTETLQQISSPAAIALLISLLLAGRIIYQLYFHPLAGYPGPKLAAISYLPYIHLNLSRRAHLKLQALHRKYGAFVRVGPSTLSIASTKGQETIHGSRPVFPKGSHYDVWVMGIGKPSLAPCRNIADHAAQKAAIAPMFHRPNMVKQERHIMQHVDMLMEKIKLHGMRRRGEDGSGLDGSGEEGMEMGTWFMAFATDVITDLAFGEAFGSLKAEKIHWVVDQMNNYFGMIVVLDCIRRFPWIYNIIPWVLPKKVTRQREKLGTFANTRLRERLENTAPRDDFITALRDQPEDQRLSTEYLIRNNVGFIIAGGETTATTLTAILHFLSRTPGAYHRLLSEIRTTFTSTPEISATNLEKLPYLNAVISEALRLFPPLVTLGIRESPAGGALIDGHYVPEGTEVFAPQYVLCHDEANFKDAEEFKPERWLDEGGRRKGKRDGEGEGDVLKACMPFSRGSRECAGRNLAMIEMRLVMARVTWEFEFEAVKEESDLLRDSEVLFVWMKAPVRLRFWQRGEEKVGA